MSELCEVCKAPATVAVGDSEEMEPIEDAGVFYRTHRLVAKHYFCEQHKREARCKPYFPTAEAETQWLSEHRAKGR